MDHIDYLTVAANVRRLGEQILVRDREIAELRRSLESPTDRRETMEYKFTFANAVWIVNMFTSVLTIINGLHTSRHTGVTTWSFDHYDLALVVQFETGYNMRHYWGLDGDRVTVEAQLCDNVRFDDNMNGGF